MAVPRTCRKIVTHTKTNVFADGAKIVEVPMPAPGPGEVLIAVKCAGTLGGDVRDDTPYMDVDADTNPFIGV